MPYVPLLERPAQVDSESGMTVLQDTAHIYRMYVRSSCFVWNQLQLLLSAFSPACKGSAQRSGTAAVYHHICGQYSLITFNIRGLYGSWEETIRHAAFQVSSIMTTTGFASTDFDLWPGFSKALLLCLMFVGACAGSTAGGLKMGRLLLILKTCAEISAEF